MTRTLDTLTESTGWWQHQYSGKANPHIYASTAAGYLDIDRVEVEQRVDGRLARLGAQGRE